MKTNKHQAWWHRSVASLLVLLVGAMSGPLPMAMSQTMLSGVKAAKHPAMPPRAVRHASRKVQIIKPHLSFTQDPTDVDISTARVFLEPLVPSKAAKVAGENKALAKAVVAFKQKQDKDNISDLTNFVKAYPKSRWVPSLKLSLGDLRYENGYLTEALADWQAAWDGAKAEVSPGMHAVADQAIGHIMSLYARLGRKADLEKLIPEIRKRGVYGSAQANLFDASLGLGTMKHHPEVAFKCGPYAVNSLLNLGKNTEAVNPILAKTASTARGTSLAQVKHLADLVGLKYQMAFRKPGAHFIVPAVMHLRLDHFTAVVSERDGFYQTKDPTFDVGQKSFSKAAMEAESDGYFLVPAGPLPEGWRTVGDAEAGKVWGKGARGYGDTSHTGDSPSVSPSGGSCNGMARASIFTSTASLNIRDIPLGYNPPVGTDMDFLINYNWGEAYQPGTFSWPTLGYNWSLNWVSYLTAATDGAIVRVRGGGYEQFIADPVFYDNVTSIYKPILNSHAVLTQLGNSVYQRSTPDGTIEIYNQPDGTGRIFLTEVIDPQGNSTTIQYDSNFRITTITDAIGQASTLTYVSNTVGNSGFYFVSQITDPFSRSATFTYDTGGTKLIKITDVIGLESKFTYESGTSTILTMSTPYGTTSFWQYYPPAVDIPAGIRFGLPDGSAAVVESWGYPQWQTYYWDREAMMMYPTDPSSLDHTHCHTTQWTLSSGASMSEEPDWIKPALESKTTFTYLNESFDGSSAYDSATNGAPIQISRPLDSGTQVYQFQNNILGKPTQSIDPMGRTFSYTYAGNNIDLLEVRQTKGSNYDLVAKYIYNSQHRPLVAIDGSGQRTQYTYNSYGQPTTITDSNNNVTTLTYDSDGYLTQIQGPLAGSSDVTDITYDGYGRIYTVTDSEGYTVTYSYDNADRITEVTYPDGTSEQTTYDRLDAVLKKDRNGRTTQYSYDNMQQLISETDPLGRKTCYEWCKCGSLRSLTDPAGNKTCWHRDLEGRVTEKIYPDNSSYSYVYETSTSRLKQRIDAFTPTPQTTNYAYNFDNSLSQVSYTNVINATSTVNYAYDPLYSRAVSIANGWGTYTNQYYANTGNPYGAAFVTIGGTVHTGDVVSIVFNNSTLSGGTRTVNYTVTSSDTTLTILAASVASAITADTVLAAANISASSVAGVVAINAPAQVGVLTLVPSVSGSGHTVTAENNYSLVSLELSGSTTTGDVVNTAVINTGLSGGQRNVKYTVASGDVSAAALATSVASALNADSVLSTAGYSATANGSQILITPPANVGPVSLRTSTNGVNTETLTTNPTVGNVLSVDIFDSSLPNGLITISYTATTSSQSTATAALATAINADSTLSAAGISATSSGGALTITSTSAGGTSYRALCNGGLPQTTYYCTFTETGGATEIAAATVASGAGRLMSVTNDVIANSVVSYIYDALGRTTNRSINGATNSDTWGYDAMSRITNETNTLGSFDYSYVDNVPGSSKGVTRLASITYPNGQVTNFSWHDNIGDQRLQRISNVTSSGANLSEFSYSYDPVGQIKQWPQIQNNMSQLYNLGYDQAGQLISAQSGPGNVPPSYANQNYYAYDAAANRTAVQKSAVIRARIGGTVTSGNTLTITVYDSALSGGSEAVTYTVVGGDTTTTIASKLAAAITANANLQAIGVNAVSGGTTISIKSVSSNTTTYTQSVSGTETITLGTTANFTQLAGIGGIKTTGDVITLNVYDPALTGGSETVTYTVLSGDTLTSIATGLKNAINANSDLSTLGVTATSAGTVVAINSASTNATTFTQSVSSGATEKVTLAVAPNGSTTLGVGGTKTTSDVLTVTVYDASLSGGKQAITYTVLSGDTLTAIATGLKNAINGQSNLQTAGVTATSSGTVVTISSNSPNLTTYHQSVSSGATETMALELPPNGTETLSLGGSKTTGDVLSVTVYDAGLSGGTKTVSYTVQSGDANLAAIATGLASVINGDTSLQNIGVSANAVSAVVNITSTSSNNTGYTDSLNSGATETMTLGTNVGVLQSSYNCLNQLTSVSAGGAVAFKGTAIKPAKSVTINVSKTATIGGTVTAGDVLYLMVHNAGLSHAEAVNYTVQSGDTLTAIATALTSAINANTVLSGLGVTAASSGAVVTITAASVIPTWYSQGVSTGATETISLNSSLGAAANLNWSESYSGNAKLGAGANTAVVTTVDGDDAATTVKLPLSVQAASGSAPTYDANGNMTSDGTNTYTWDAENRLIKITYPGTNNYSSFTYDGFGRRVKIVETVAGSVTSTKQFVGPEERDGTGAVTKQFFGLGERIGSTSYFFTQDHLGSVREMTDSSGVIQAQYSYDPYGNVTKLQGSLTCEFQYAGYYMHDRSGLNLTATRAYNAGLARFINRDPIEEDGGINLYGYVGNDSIAFSDPSGLDKYCLWAGKGPFSNQPFKAANGPASGAPNSGGPPDFTNPGGKGNRGDEGGTGGGGGGGGGDTSGGFGNPLFDVFRPGIANLKSPAFLGGIGIAALVIFSGGAGATVASSGGGEVLPMTIVKMLPKGTATGIVDEAKWLTLKTGNEHALVRLANGGRALVSGGKGGIDFGKAITRLIFHTHPKGVGPSAADFNALRLLKQVHSYILESGQVIRFGP